MSQKIPDWGGIPEQKEDTTKLLQGHPVFDQCELRASGAGHGFSAHGLHSRI